MNPSLKSNDQLEKKILHIWQIGNFCILKGSCKKKREALQKKNGQQKMEHKGLPNLTLQNYYANHTFYFCNVDLFSVRNWRIMSVKYRNYIVSRGMFASSGIIINMSACTWGFLPREIYRSVLCDSLLMVTPWIAAPLAHSSPSLIEHFYPCLHILLQLPARLNYLPAQSKLPSQIPVNVS